MQLIRSDELSHAQLLREAYTELLHVTSTANQIEREAGELRSRAAALSLKIHLLLKAEEVR